MTGVLILVLTGAAVVALGLLRALFTSVLVGEAKGFANDAIERKVARAASLLPPALAPEMADEWRLEVECLKDRPLKALAFVRGLHSAARTMANDLVPELAGAPISEVTKLKERMVGAGEFEIAAALRSIEVAYTDGFNLPPESSAWIARARRTHGSVLRRSLRALKPGGRQELLPQPSHSRWNPSEADLDLWFGDQDDVTFKVTAKGLMVNVEPKSVTLVKPD